jgi:hypothetical protein
LSTLLLAIGLSAITQTSAHAAVVTSNLVLHLDARNSTSYPGSGTTWYDTAKNFNGTLTNGAVYENVNGVGIQLDGVDDYVSLPPISTDFSSGFSTTFYANFGSSQSFERVLDFGSGQQADNFVVSRSGGTSDFYFEAFSASTSIGICKVLGAIDTSFHHWAVTLGSNTCAIYKDGVAQTTVNGSGTASSTFSGMPRGGITRTQNYLGKSNWGDPYADIIIGAISVYNRALSSSEVYQNYSNEIPPCTATPTYAGNSGYVTLQTKGTCGWTVPYGANSYNYLIVGGGGGGGGGYKASWNGAGGGGGGGEVLSGSTTFTSGDVHAITIGGGGSGGNGETTTSDGMAGETTTVLTLSKAAKPGQPGLKGSLWSSCGVSSGNGGNSGNGNAGGTQNCDAGGSGAGSSAVGGLSYDVGGQGACGGQGGAGTSSNITGSNIPYGAGGGAGGDSSVGTTTNSNCPNGGTGGRGGSAYLTGFAGGDGAQTFYSACSVSTNCVFSSNAAATAGVTFGSGGGGGSYNGSSPTSGVNTGSTSTAGGAGAGGVVIFSWTILNGAVNSITFSGSVKKLAPVVITANVTNSGKVNFFANGRAIPRCQGISTTGSSPNITAVCSWKPITHGSQYVTATVYSASGAFTTGSNYTGTSTSKRTTAR